MKKITFFLSILACFFSVVTSGAALKKKIIIFHSYPPGEWYHGINGAFEETLGQLGIQTEITPVVFHSEFWLRKSPEELAKEQERLLKIAKDGHPDLVLICDDEANDLLAVKIYQMGIPILFTGVNRSKDQVPFLKTIPAKNIAGVLELYQIAESIELIRKLKPGVKSFSILTSDNSTSEIVAKEITATMKNAEFERDHKVVLRSVNKLRYWEDWKKVVPEINKKDDALWVLVPYDVRDVNNQEVPISQIGQWLTKQLSIPTLGIISIHTKIGLFAAVSIGPEALGKQSAEQAARFFHGESLDQIGVENARYAKMEINLTEAKRLKIKIPSDLMGIASLVETPTLKYGR